VHTSSSSFWKIAASIPLATAAVSGSAQTAQLTAASEQQAGAWKFHHEHVLGTSLEMTIQAANAADASRAEEAVLALFDHDEAILSTWCTDSEVSRWAKTHFQPTLVSAELFEVLAAYDYWREHTGGALDPSVEAATRIWAQAAAEDRMPSDHEIAMTIEAMQQPHWSLDAQHFTATHLTDVPLAFASFTKSYISSRAADAALSAGATGIMLNVGGDVIVRGDLTQRVAVVNPVAASENDLPLDYLLVRDRTVATSGSYRRGFDLANAIATAAPQFSHLIDPRTAQPSNHILSSTVVARDAITAGALATAFSILPVEEIRRLASEYPDVQYMLVFTNGEQISSSTWPHSPHLRQAAYPYRAASPISSLSNPAFELSIELNLPRVDDARYRRPYVAVWVEDADHYPVRTLALWFEKARWLPDLKQWYRDDQLRSMTEGSDISRTVSSATRPPGKYTLKWDGKDNEGKSVKAGKYTICIEAAREHGGYDLQRHEIDLNSKPQQTSIPEAKELGATTLDYHKR